MLVAGFLSCCGCKVIGPVATVQAALSLLERGRPDVALLDVELSDGEKVTPVAERLTHQGVPVVLVTGCTASSLPSPELRHKLLVPKPASKEALMEALTACCDGEEPHQPRPIAN